MREARYAIRVQLPASIVAKLNREAERRAGLLHTITPARDSLIAELLSGALSRIEQPSATGCNLQHSKGS
jgi:hypothetical protein